MQEGEKLLRRSYKKKLRKEGSMGMPAESSTASKKRGTDDVEEQAHVSDKRRKEEKREVEENKTFSEAGLADQSCKDQWRLCVGTVGGWKTARQFRGFWISRSQSAWIFSF